MKEYDGFMFGLSGRFGTMPAQVKAFMDSTGSLWQSGALVGKTAGTFTSVGTMGGGQETVNLACIPYFVHQGMVFVPLGICRRSSVYFRRAARSIAVWFWHVCWPRWISLCV